jgi:hypothetical protein
MPNDELTLVLSGHLCRPQTADLRPFWRGFIELQRKLPTSRKVGQIVVHSWNPELAGLARAVYAPHAECHETQPCFYPEFVHRIDPPDRFELGLDRLNSTWKNVSLQSVLGNARSRAKAVQLMDKLPDQAGQVLVTRWDLGQTGSAQVNQLVADAAMPASHLYLSYFSEVDEGYADMWLLAPWAIARRFGDFDAFVLDALEGKNAYLKEFSESGWPRARKKTRYEDAISHPVGQRAHALASRLIGAIRSRALGGTLPERVLRRLTGPIQRFLERPPLTAENSCVMGLEAAPRTFPSFMALNIHALLKYFILSEGLREQTRFLTREDFEISMLSGQLINPQPVVLLLWGGDDDGQALSRLVEGSPLPLDAVYLLGGGAARVWTPAPDGSGAMRVLAPGAGSDRDRLSCALADVANQAGESAPVLIMPTAAAFLNCQDWYYLNALLKHIAWRQQPYVGLNGGQSVKVSMEFPGLSMARGGGAFSLNMAAGTAGGIRPFLDASDLTLNGLSERADRMLLEFPVVVKDGGLF